MKALRDEIIRGYVISFFYTCEDLGAKVTASIANFGTGVKAPYNVEREHRLLKTFITSDDQMERSRASSALLNMRSKSFADLLRARLVAREGESRRGSEQPRES